MGATKFISTKNLTSSLFFALIFLIIAPKIFKVLIGFIKKVFEFLRFWLGIDIKPTL